jgi:polyhydroxybutyrate depolymerase
LLDTLPSLAAVDLHRIYVTGFSNGAAMTFRLGVDLSERLAAIAPVAGRCAIKDPEVKRAIPTLFLVGARDPLVPFDGGEVRSPWTGETSWRPPVQESLHRWARALGCPTDPVVMQCRDGVRIVRYGPGRNDAELVAYTIAGLGHHWPGGLGGFTRRIAGEPSGRVKANDIIWAFFQRHTLP